ncbi:MAG: ABC transporter ATP-binding protein [Opitutaceae bacterium]|jgi:NitT/TauT family transport system ATP-binding protein
MQCAQNPSPLLDIEVAGLRKSFGGRNGDDLVVFDGLTFSVARGSLLAIVGPSGCGKSTLLRILAGCESKSAGKVHVDEDRRAHSASIEQRPALLPWRTAFQNACLGAEVRGRLNSTIAQRVRDAFESFGLKGFEDHFPPELSGGMQQRVAIIRALESSPWMLFCDEPFSAIDFVARLGLSTEFKKMCRLLGCTTLFVTHNIEEAIFLGDRILVMGKRPCQIVDDLSPALSRFPEDAVKCRQSPEFAEYFDRIWAALETKPHG